MEANFFESIKQSVPQNYAKLFVEKILISSNIRKTENGYYNSRSYRLADHPFPITKMKILLTNNEK
jgi:hypothetical protein